MKNYFIQSIKIIAIALCIGWGVSAVYAWTAPTVNPPATGAVKAPSNDTAKGVAATINTTNFDQVKQGGLIISDLKKAFVAPLSFFKQALLPGNDTSVYIGGASFGNPNFLSSFPSDHRIPLTINLTGRSQVNDAVRVIAGATCPAPVEFVTDASAFQLWRTENRGDNADILAKGVRLTGGNPARGKILIAVDSDGKAVWATPTLAANGRDIVFDTNTSPVGSCVTPEPPHPILDLCLNITGNQSTIPLNMVQNGSNCVCDSGYTLSGGVCIADQEPSTEPFVIGCFLQNTKITMSDGSSKDIEDVVVGDHIKAVNGINTVQKLLRPKLGNQPVYSMNGSSEFFTANHPFLTTKGWKSIDPETTHTEIPDLPVTKMVIGDTLITQHGNVVITSLVPKHASSNTQLYNFELDGDHTYYANGYAVHNKVAILDSNPNPACDLNPSTTLSDCREYNHYYCKVADGNTRGQCVPTVSCDSNSDCQSGPLIGLSPDQIQLVNGSCLMATLTIHPADSGEKFCKW